MTRRARTSTLCTNYHFNRVRPSAFLPVYGLLMTAPIFDLVEMDYDAKISNELAEGILEYSETSQMDDLLNEPERMVFPVARMPPVKCDSRNNC
jgi:hypothetical protein